MTVKELREQAANLIEQARALQHKAEEEKRDLTDEESANFDRYIDDAEALEAKAEKAEADKARRSRLADVADRFADHRSRPRTQHDDISRVEPATPDREEVIRRGWETALRYHPDNLTTEQRGYISEARALQADLDVSGGYLTAPPQFNAQLIEAVRNDIVIGGLATQMTIPTNEVVQWPVLDTRPDNPDVRGEIETITADSGTAFGLREFTPVKYAKSVVISDKLTSIAGLDIDSLMIDLYRYEFADTFDAAFATGTGANAPLGLFTAATNGISTSRDVSTGNSTTAFTLDGLINALYSLKSQYQRRARWLFHRDAVKLLAKLKDGEGRYQWMPSVREGQPSTLLGLPVLMSENAPNTFTTGLYTGMVADFSKYYVFNFLGGAVEFKRFDEYHAGTDLGSTGQHAIRAQMYVDAGPVLEEAFARVTLA